MRNKYGNYSMLFGIFTLIMVLIFFSLKDNINSLSFDLEIIVGIMAVVSGIIGIVAGYFGHRKCNLDSVKEFFDKGDDESLPKARQKLMNTPVDEINLADYYPIINFYQQ